MNKKGSIGFSIILGIFFFMIGLTMTNFIMDDITTARASNALNCSDADNISDGNKLLCLAVDLLIPYFIAVIFSITATILTRRLI